MSIAEPKIRLDKLKKGDILLYTGDGDTLDNIIEYLSDSNVTHAAMSYDQQGMVIEEDPPQARTISGTDRYTRTTYVMRLKSGIDTKPVVEVADKYVAEGLPYLFTDLVWIGIYFLVKKIAISKSL